MYQQIPQADQQLPSTLDPERLEAFRKNWEYYKMWNPQVIYVKSGVDIYEASVGYLCVLWF